MECAANSGVFLTLNSAEGNVSVLERLKVPQAVMQPEQPYATQRKEKAVLTASQRAEREQTLFLTFPLLHRVLPLIQLLVCDHRWWLKDEGSNLLFSGLKAHYTFLF